MTLPASIAVALLGCAGVVAAAWLTRKSAKESLRVDEQAKIVAGMADLLDQTRASWQSDRERHEQELRHRDRRIKYLEKILREKGIEL